MPASRLADLIDAGLATAYAWIALGALAYTVAVFAVLAARRNSVDRAMADTRKPLGFFDLSWGDTVRRQRERRPTAPEKLWTYDETYLTKFARLALESDIGPGNTALKVYVRSILYRLDILFALGLGTFSVATDLAIAQALGPEYPIALRAAWICASMGFLYFVADVSEDLKLGAIFSQTLVAKDRHVVNVDAAEAAAVNLLTRVKVVTLACSGTGLLLFVGLAIALGVALRLPHSPLPVPGASRKPELGSSAAAAT